jgi:putative membrane protein
VTGPTPSPGQAAAFGVGLGVLAAALLSPLAALSHVLFSAHMVQHLLLVTVAPPLLAWGRPGRVLLANAPPGWRTRLRMLAGHRLVRGGGALGRNAVVVVVLSVASLWGWHAPVLYQAAVRNEAVHVTEHLCLFGTSFALWRLVVGAPGRHRPGRALMVVFVAGLAGAALGALLTFSTSVLYPVFGDGPRAWGLTPLEDQQLAGSIMWIPPALLSLLTMVGLAHCLIAEAERRSAHSARSPVRAGQRR